MRTWIIGALASAAGFAAHAQTYDLDITMTGVASGPVTFSGDFTFNRAANGVCSAALCAPGITPGFANVLIRDPLSLDPPGGAFAFTNAAGTSSTLVFFDTYLGPPGQSSFVYQLGFTLDQPLGGQAASIGLSNVYFATDADVFGIYSCGGATRIETAGVTCTAALTEERTPSPGLAAGGDRPSGVPEPGTFPLLALALAGLGIARPRKSS